MNPVAKKILAVISGLILGSFVNMGIIMIGPNLIPPPEGVNVTDMDSLAKAMPLFEPKHFIFPFLAHALGTLVGAIIATSISGRENFRQGIAVGILFLIGGIINVVNLPSPVWFSALDLIAAYIPMGWLGAKFVIKS